MHRKLAFVAAALLCGLLIGMWAGHAAAAPLAQGLVTGDHRSYLPLAFGSSGTGGGIDLPPTPVPTPTPIGLPIAPQDGSVYTGVALPGVPWDMNALMDWERNVAGKTVSIIHYWSFWSSGSQFQRFDRGTMDSIRNHGSIPMVTWAPEELGLGVDQPAFRLANIISGQYDASIRQWADNARAWGHPFFLRFAHEPDGSWFAWGEDANGNQRGQYVQAWRHVHDIFTAAGATNATWVWCLNEEWNGSPRPSYASLYPGDSYVDWSCIDGYNWGTQYGGWRSFDGIFRYSYDTLLQVAPTKPIMLGEWASAGIGGNKADWITDAFTVKIPSEYPRIRAEVWYNWVTNVDWRVESTTGAAQALRAAMSGSIYRGAEFGDLK